MRTRLLWVLAAMMAGVPAAGGETLAGLQAGSGSRLEAALAELSELRQQIEGERLPLAESVNALERRVLDRRRELERAERANENALVVLNAERAQGRARGEEVRFVEALLGEYLRVFETRIHIAEVDRWSGRIEAAKEAGSGLGREPAERLDGMLGVIDLALDRLGEVSGGSRFEGKALTSAGRLEAGIFRLVGPVAYFASGESGEAGLAELQLGSAGPTVVPLGPEATGWIREFAASGTGRLPVDVTGGNALKLARTKDGVVEHVLKGGPVMVPIVALGLFAVGMFGGKWFQLARVRIATPMDLQGILAAVKSGKRDRAVDQARGVAGPVGRMLERAIGHVDEPKEYIEEVMYEEMLQTKPRLEKWLPFIALAAAAAPLLGLLGTVTGMINTFNMITVFGTGDPKTLAGGISEALITTEFGLIVAIPSLLLHSVLSRKVKAVLGSMEQTTVAFINGLERPGEKGVPAHGHA